MHHIINKTNKEQTIPPQSAFNSLVTDEHVTKKTVTEYSVVYSSQELPRCSKLLDESHMPVTCDEGVYHIAREIIMNTPPPPEFTNLVLCLGYFHLINVVIGAIGKYIGGSGAETIFVESKAYYTRSLKRLMLLSECIERLQWAEFFKTTGIKPNRN